MSAEVGPNFRIFDFMITRMKLKGSELMVFALIYSFTISEGGEFHGSREYIARRTALSERSVDRALKSLSAEGWILNLGRRGGIFSSIVYKADLDKISGILRAGKNKKSATEAAAPASEEYRADEKNPSEHTTEIEEKNGKAEDEELPHGYETWSKEQRLRYYAEEIEKFLEEGAQIDEDELTDCQDGDDGLSYDNEVINKSIKQYTFRSKYAQYAHPMTHTYTNDRDIKYRFACYGRDGEVELTDEQMDHLLSLVEMDVLYPYIIRLEKYITDPSKPPVYSCYKTLLRWIRWDMEPVK